MLCYDVLFDVSFVMKKICRYAGFITLLISFVACDPVTLMFGGTALVGTTAVRNQNGVTGSISDAALQTKINKALFSEDKELFDRVELCIKHGMVVAIGYMENEDQKQRAISVIKQIKDCVDVFDELHIQNMPTAADVAADATLTSRMKTSLAFDGNVQSLNYDVTTVKRVAYICGIAQSKYERDVVLNHMRTTSGVEKVISYIKINEKQSNVIKTTGSQKESPLISAEKNDSKTVTNENSEH